MQVETLRTSTHFQKSSPNYSAAVRAGFAVHSSGVGEDLHLNVEFLKSKFAVVQVIQMIIAIICLVSISPPRTWYSIVFTFVIAVAFAVTTASFFCYLVTMKNVILPRFNWYIPELIYTSTAAVLLLVTAIIHLVLSTRQTDKYHLEIRGYFDGYIVAGIFGLINSFVYCVGIYLLVTEKKQEANAYIDNSG